MKDGHRHQLLSLQATANRGKNVSHFIDRAASGMKEILILVAMVFAVAVSGCASIAAYQASHPPYRFPVSGGGGGGGNGG